EANHSGPWIWRYPRRWFTNPDREFSIIRHKVPAATGAITIGRIKIVRGACDDYFH
ncbi:MAG: hypothetical protein GY801_17050, partial [bacterium]|nr:hypothetical protein [bacterium]